MKRSGSDYWPLYHDDFWSSPTVLAMTDQEKLVFIFLLGLQWKHGSIPNDPRPLIYGMSSGARRCVETVLRQFPAEVEGGSRRNRRLAEEQARVDENRAAARARAEKSRDMRARHTTEESRVEKSRGEVPPVHPPTPGTATPPHDSVPVKPRKQRLDPATMQLPVELDTDELRAALADYLATRKGGHWSPSLAAVRLRQLAEWGHDRAVAALKHSVGYQGLFEPSGRVNGIARKSNTSEIDELRADLRKQEPMTINVERINR